MSIFDNMKKALAIAPVISAMVGLVDGADGVDGPTKKAALMGAWDALEKALGFDWDDKYVSVGIEVLLSLGKLTGILKGSGGSSPALSGGTGSKTS